MTAAGADAARFSATVAVTGMAAKARHGALRDERARTQAQHHDPAAATPDQDTALLNELPTSSAR